MIVLIFLLSCHEDPFAHTDLNNPASLKKRGYELMKKGRYRDAFKVFKFAYDKFKHDPYIKMGLARAALKVNRHGLAQRVMVEACWEVYQNPKLRPISYKVFRDFFVKVRDAYRKKYSGKPGFSNYISGGPQLGILARVKSSLTKSEFAEVEKAAKLYRLKFKRLPHSLDEIIQAGFLPPSSKQDNNGLPIYSYYKGGELILHAAGADMVMETDDDIIYVIK